MNRLRRRIKSVSQLLRERRERARAEVVIVSFPKCGRTWLRMLIGRALCERYGLPEAQMLDTLALTRAAGLPPSVFSHDGTGNTAALHMDRLARDKSEYHDKSVLLLIRDPRDVLVSCFFQATRRRELFEGTLSDFVRDPRHGIHKILTHASIWHEARHVPRELEVVRYEDLMGDAEKTLAAVLTFIGLHDPDGAMVRDSVEFSTFENMKNMESQQRFESSRMQLGKGDDPDSRKVRRGVIGGYVDYLSPADLAYCDAALEQLWCPLSGIDR